MNPITVTLYVDYANLIAATNYQTGTEFIASPLEDKMDNQIYPLTIPVEYV